MGFDDEFHRFAVLAREHACSDDKENASNAPGTTKFTCSRRVMYCTGSACTAAACWYACSAAKRARSTWAPSPAGAPPALGLLPDVAAADAKASHVASLQSAAAGACELPSA